MEIFLAINHTNGYMEMIFDNEPDALSWTEVQTAKTGNIYSIECEDACQNFCAPECNSLVTVSQNTP